MPDDRDFGLIDGLEDEVLELRDDLESIAQAEGQFALEVFRYLFPGRQGSIAERVLRLEEKVNRMSDGLVAIQTAVGHVATAVTDISNALKAHPVVDQDPALKTLAVQLEGAAATLEGIANPPAPVITPPAPTPTPTPAPAGGGSPAPTPAPVTDPTAGGAGAPPPPPPAA